MKNQFVINFLVNGLEKSGTINIFDDRVILVVDNQKMNLEFSNIKGGYIDNSGMLQIVLKNDIRLTINGFENTKDIFDLFEKNRSTYHEVDFFDGDNKVEKSNIIPLLFKSIFLGGVIGAGAYFLLDYYKVDYELWYLIAGSIAIVILNFSSQSQKVKVSSKMNLNAYDLIDAITRSMQNCEKILDDTSTGIIIDNDYKKFCIMKPPFSNYNMLNLSDVLDSEIVVNNDSNNHYCTKLYIKLKLSDNGMVTNDFIPFIVKKVVVNSSVFQKKYEFAEKLNSYFLDVVKKYHGVATIKKSEEEVRQEHIIDNNGIEADEWKL